MVTFKKNLRKTRNILLKLRKIYNILEKIQEKFGKIIL